MNTIDDLQEEAQDVVRQMMARDFGGASRLFDSDMAQALPVDKLKDMWLQLTGLAGAFQEIERSTVMEIGEKRIVTVTCQFEKGAIDVYVAFDTNGQIAGLNVVPTPTTSPYQLPAYVDEAAFREVEVMVGSGEWALPGTLSTPVGAGPFPAVVLVHGSGPQDRDETVGGVRFFRDLAWGLASQGILALRYDKRTKVHAEQLTPEVIASMTIQDEVIDDALAAVKLLRQTPGIDPQHIYVLGHSLGATVAPLIGQQDPAIAGLIIAAGLTRPLEDTILDQFTYTYSLSGSMSDSQKAELEELKVKVARVKDPSLSDQVPAKDLPLGLHPAYWLALREYRPAEVALSLEMRIFVLQGGRDYQVTVEGDYPGWQKALGRKSNATLKLYPRLSHTFTPGEGRATPQEYLAAAHVDGEVIRDIASWIKSK
jgi:dienelactone hydrolase